MIDRDGNDYSHAADHVYLYRVLELCSECSIDLRRNNFPRFRHGKSWNGIVTNDRHCVYGIKRKAERIKLAKNIRGYP